MASALLKGIISLNLRLTFEPLRGVQQKPNTEMNINTKLLQLTAAGAMALGAVSSAQAVATLTMFESVSNTTIVVTDQGAGDSSAVVGSVLWFGAIGAFNVNVNTGLTKPVNGTATNPRMDLNFTANSTGVGNLTITFADDGFTYTGGLQDVFGGTAGNNTTITDTVLKNGAVFITQGPFATGAYAATSNAFVTLVPADVLAIRVNIAVGAGQNVSSGNKDVHAAPDNGLTVSLLGGAMVGLLALRRKLRAA